MNVAKTYDRGVELFDELRKLLDAEGETNWIRGVKSAIASLKCDDNDSAKEAALKDACSVFESMHGGAGSFSDFCIWRDDFDERKRANEVFSRLCDEIWQVVELTRSVR